MNGMDFMDENVVLNKLVDNKNGVKHYRLIKSSINEGWISALTFAHNQENILKNRPRKRKENFIKTSSTYFEK